MKMIALNTMRTGKKNRGRTVLKFIRIRKYDNPFGIGFNCTLEGDSINNTNNNNMKKIEAFDIPFVENV